MNKGRLFVVDENTLQLTIENNIASIYTPELNGKQWLKTIADIMADMLQIEIGDYIFFWETKSENNKSRIHGIYRAISAPYYEMDTPDDNYPFKIKIEPAYIFQNSLDEYDVLNCPYIRTPLWTITGKKVAGKSRGTSPLSPSEVNNLIVLLIGRNPNYQFIPFSPERIISILNPLHVDLTLKGDINLPTIARYTINPNTLPFLNTDGNVKYEKILETIFNQELSARNRSFFNQIGVDVDRVIWFSNYLPYSVEQSEMDYLIIESDDGMHPSKICLIEFIKTKIDEPHIYRSLLYSKWVNETLALGESITNPMIICPESYNFIDGESKESRVIKMNELDDLIRNYENSLKTKHLGIYTYDFSAASPSFKKKR